MFRMVTSGEWDGGEGQGQAEDFIFTHSHLYCLIFLNHNHHFYIWKFILHKTYKFQWIVNCKSDRNRKKLMKTVYDPSVSQDWK